MKRGNVPDVPAVRNVTRVSILPGTVLAGKLPSQLHHSGVPESVMPSLGGV